MKYRIEIPTNIIEESFSLALSKPANTRGDFFHELRSAFKSKLENVFIENGIEVNSHGSLGYTNYLRNGIHHKWDAIVKYTGWNNDIKQELDLEFCAKYGHDDYSLRAINYIDRTLCGLPSLYSFSSKEIFSIGNILILTHNYDYKIELSLGEGVNATGYACHISKRKKKSYLCVFGIWFNHEAIAPAIDRYKLGNYENKDELDEIRIGTISYPIIYINRITGELYTCSCFKGYFEVQNDIVRLLPYGNSEEGLRSRVNNIRTIDGLCHLCNGGIPKYEYGHSMYYSSFLQRYLPYHGLLSRKKYGRALYEGEEYKEIENEVREQFGYQKIGEQWVSETTLYKIVCMLYPDMEVVHHYRGNELEGLELDIWIPERRIGIEYQGEQHYQAIEHWGGEEGLRKRMENDKKKKRLCKELGYHIIEFKHNEDFSEELIKRRVSKYIVNQA